MSDIHEDVALDDAKVPPTSLRIKGAMLAAVALPPIGLICAMTLAWGGFFGWTDLCLVVSLYVLTGLGITIGFHRLYTHKAFSTSAPIAYFFTIFGSMAGQGPLLWWAHTHRRHHQHSDREHDPHSPHAARSGGFMSAAMNFVHAHLGWLFKDQRRDGARYVPDLIADSVVLRVTRFFPLWVLLGILIPAAIGGLVTMSWTGALLGGLWGGPVRMFLLHHSTWSVNSVCHVWGKRAYRSGDESRNNPIMGILALGEGWHNNHHAFPASARHGLEWWQFDLSWIVIRSLERLGLVHDVRLPSKARLDARRLTSTANA